MGERQARQEPAQEPAQEHGTSVAPCVAPAKPIGGQGNLLPSPHGWTSVVVLQLCEP